MATPLPADPTAVFGRRVLAAVLDLLLLLVPAGMLASAQLEYLELGSDRQASDFCEDFMDAEEGVCASFEETAYFGDEAVGQAFGAAVLAIGVVNLVVLQGLTGFSVGKLLTGLRTVRADGSACGIGRAFVRWILWVVDGQPCGLPLVGFITGLTTVGHRRVGDMAAKTFVVGAGSAGSPVAVPGLTAPLAAPAGYATAGAWGSPPPGPTWGTSPSPPPPSDPGTAGWAAPGESTPDPDAGGPSQQPPGPAAPQWDEARGTYIQWDPSQSAWLQWDEAARSWSRIPGQ